jgi:hypothetical protein
VSTPTRQPRQAKAVLAERAFHERVVAQGGRVVGRYVTALTPVECICAAGHACRPWPSYLQQGGGMCQVCAAETRGKTKSRPVEEAFRRRVVELGGRVIGNYAGANTPVDCVCAEGHTCRPRPANLQRGQGLCRTCAGRLRRAGLTPTDAEAAFRARVTEIGGQVLGKYAGAGTPVDCVCAAGHSCRPKPSKVQQGRGICRVCAGKDPAAAEGAFRARVAELGGRVVGEYVSVAIPIACVCVNGHPCQPRPADLKRGQGMCRTCAGLCPVAAERAFRDAVSAQGGLVVGAYVDSGTPVPVICRLGHACAPNPSNVQRGQGVCHTCRGKVWDAFYVVANPVTNRLKFGITSGSPRHRLTTHRRTGYVEAVRVLPDLADARALEGHILNTLRDAGVPAAHGREYFDLGALALVLDVVDGWNRDDQAGVAGPAPDVTVPPTDPYDEPNALSE